MNRMIIYVILAVACLCVFLVWWTLNRSRPMGFREWLRDPIGYRIAVEEGERERQVTITEPVTDADIRSWVNRLLKPSKADRAAIWLRKVGPRAVPFLVEALADSRFIKSRTPDDHVMSKSALEHVLDILEDFRDPTSVGAIARLWTQGDETIRKVVANTIATIGHVDGEAVVLEALKSDDEDIQTWCVMGLESAMCDDRAGPILTQQVFEALVPLLDSEANNSNGPVAQLLLHADRKRAESLLLSNSVLNVNNDSLHNTLAGLRESNLEIPGNTLTRLEAELRPRVDEFPYYYAYREVLLAIAEARAPQAEEIVRVALTSSSRHVREAAAEATAHMKGVGDPWKLLIDRSKKVGLKGLTISQQNAFAVWQLQYEVENGGFRQYFFNAEDGHWPIVRRGLEAVGAKHALRLFHKALEKFGSVGPPLNRLETQLELAKIIGDVEDELWSLDRSFYEDHDDLEVRLWLYIAEHHDEFLDE